MAKLKLQSKADYLEKENQKLSAEILKDDIQIKYLQSDKKLLEAELEGADKTLLGMRKDYREVSDKVKVLEEEKIQMVDTVNLTTDILRTFIKLVNK